MSTALAARETNELEAQPRAQNAVEWAIHNQVSPEQMLQFLEVQRQINAENARKAFNAAFAAFKAEAVRIVKNTKVVAGPLANTVYANLYDVVNAVTPKLAEHQLSHSWKLTKDEKDWMEVTCTIRHALGHSESVSMGAAPDAGPGRNAIQARGSAKTYLERYTLLAAVGLSATGADDDGNAAAQTFLSEVLADIRNEQDPDKVTEIARNAYKVAKGNKDNATCTAIINAKDARIKELTGE